MLVQPVPSSIRIALTFFQSSSIAKELRTYELYHEIFNEIGKERVFGFGSMDQNARLELCRLIRKLSYREGDHARFGQEERFYVDLKTDAFSEGAHLIGRVASEVLEGFARTQGILSMEWEG